MDTTLAQLLNALFDLTQKAAQLQARVNELEATNAALWERLKTLQTEAEPGQ